MCILESSKIQSALNSKYEFTILDCTLLGRNFHDNYILKTNKGQFFVRVYKPGVRKLTEILFELDLINHLKNKGISVSFPIPRKDNSFITQVNTALGIRQIVVFSFASGEYPEPSDESVYLYGKFIGMLQNATKDFETNHHRFTIFDMEQITNHSLKLIKEFLKYRISDLNYLEELAIVMKNKINSLSLQNLSIGPCHGDLHFMNVHISNNQNYTLFDFDCCANGFQVYDLGTIRWEFAFCDDLWEMFLNGYTEVRNLNKDELEAIPLFATLRNFWVIGHNLDHREIFGVKQCDDEYWDENLKFIKRWVQKNNYM